MTNCDSETDAIKHDHEVENYGAVPEISKAKGEEGIMCGWRKSFLKFQPIFMLSVIKKIIFCFILFI